MLSKSKVKYIQSLSHKKLRDEEGVFVAEGPKIVHDLLAESDLTVLEIFATREWIGVNEAGFNGNEKQLVTEVDDSMLDRISFLTTPHQVLAIFRKPVYKSFSCENTVSLMLDTIQDPGNMGTIIRNADWFGIRNIICSVDSADAFAPKVVQASMGSIGRIRIVYVHLPDFINRNPDVPVYAASLHGTSLYTAGKINCGFILIGNESKGISDELQSMVKNFITIPRRGKAESLNAAVATAVILSHLVN